MEHRYKTLKVCITITSDIYFDQRVQKIASSLQEKGYSVTVLSRRKNGASERAFPFLITSIKSFFKSGFFFYAEYNFRLYFKLLFKEFDIVYACDLDTLLPATLVAGMRNKKLVFDAHEYFEESIEIVDRPIVSGIWTRIAKFCIPKTNLRITVSESLATQLSEKYRLPFHLVRNVPELRAQEINEFRKKMIWYQGAINTGRGLETMIEIMEELPEYSLYMAGYGDLFEDLNRRVSELHLKSRVRFLGRLSYQEMSEFAKSAFVGIDLLDSRSLSYYYSLSNKRIS
jgi:glycosyltransferase involved in cell wall biosynthesis